MTRCVNLAHDYKGRAAEPGNQYTGKPGDQETGKPADRETHTAPGLPVPGLLFPVYLFRFSGLPYSIGASIVRSAGYSYVEVAMLWTPSSSLVFTDFSGSPVALLTHSFVWLVSGVPDMLIVLSYS